MQHFLKPPRGAAGTEVVAAELLEQLLVAAHDALAALHARLGRESPSGAYWCARKQGRRSKKSSERMVHLRAMQVDLQPLVNTPICVGAPSAASSGPTGAIRTA